MPTLTILLLALAAAITVLCAVAIARAIAFRPKQVQPIAPVPTKVDADAAADALCQLIRCKTVSHQDTALDDTAAFARLEALLPALYPNVHRVCAFEKIAPRALLFHWRGQSDQDPLVLTAHYDVVPAADGDWSFDPFAGDIVQGEIRGRGTLDTKGTLAAVLAAAETLIGQGFAPARDVYLCFGGDEEVMGGGAKALAATLAARGVRPFMLVDEGGAIVEKVFPGVAMPCALVGIAEKGSVNYRLAAVSKGGHSSAPPAHTPVDILAKACLAIKSKPFPFRPTLPARLMVDSMARHSTFLYRLIFANLWLFGGVLNLICRISGGELNALFRTTTAFTVVRAGDTANVLPAMAEMLINARILPGETPEGTLAALRAKVHDPRVTVSMQPGLAPSGISGTEGAGYAALTRAILQTYPGVLTAPYLMIAASDARHYEGICGHVYRFSGMPLTGAERRMIHGVDERIPVAKLADTVRFFMRLIVNSVSNA